MKQQDKKKAMVLAALVGILVAYWGYRLLFQPAPSATPEPARKAAAQKAAPMNSIKVDLGLLNKPKPKINAGRNIFSPVYVKPALVKPPPLPKGQQKQPITVAPLPPLPPPPPPKSPAEIAAENAREEIKKIKVLGYLKRKGITNVFMSLGGDHFTVPLGGNITKEYYLTNLDQDSVQVTDKATGVAETIKTQFSSKPTTMPVGGGAAGAGAAGAPPRGGGASPYPGGGGPGGYRGPGGGAGGSGTTMTVIPGAAPSPLGGRSVR